MNEQANGPTVVEQMFQLSSEIEIVKAELKRKQIQLEEILTKLGVNTYYQDLITGAVYKVYKPEGTFINFKAIDVKRTNLAGEKSSSALSKSEAESMGFILKK